LDIRIVKGKSSEVSDGLREYAELKVGRLTRYSSRLQAASITFQERASKNRDRAFRVEVVLHSAGKMLRVVEERPSFQAALDTAVDELKEQLKKLKAKRLGKARSAPPFPVMVAPAAAEAPPAKAQPRVVVKKFTLKPMSLEEAIMQLDLSGHDFFLFVSEQKLIQCVYKRDQGGYGLLVPESVV
jgi:putative sigma-54 modulation protein